MPTPGDVAELVTELPGVTGGQAVLLEGGRLAGEAGPEWLLGSVRSPAPRPPRPSAS
jgi:hypothetical protein